MNGKVINIWKDQGRTGGEWMERELNDLCIHVKCPTINVKICTNDMYYKLINQLFTLEDLFTIDAIGYSLLFLPHNLLLHSHFYCFLYSYPFPSAEGSHSLDLLKSISSSAMLYTK